MKNHVKIFILYIYKIILQIDFRCLSVSDFSLHKTVTQLGTLVLKVVRSAGSLQLWVWAKIRYLVYPQWYPLGCPKSQKTPEMNELETDKTFLKIWAHNFEKQKS